MWDTYSTSLESDLKRTDRVELVTTPPDTEPNYNTEDPDIDEYDDTEDISRASSASTNRYPQVVCADNDYPIECPSDRNVKICNSQLCDRIENCPNGEDESQCQVGK